MSVTESGVSAASVLMVKLKVTVLDSVGLVTKTVVCALVVVWTVVVVLVVSRLLLCLSKSFAGEWSFLLTKTIATTVFVDVVLFVVLATALFAVVKMLVVDDIVAVEMVVGVVSVVIICVVVLEGAATVVFEIVVGAGVVEAAAGVVVLVVVGMTVVAEVPVVVGIVLAVVIAVEVKSEHWLHPPQIFTQPHLISQVFVLSGHQGIHFAVSSTSCSEK